MNSLFPAQTVDRNLNKSLIRKLSHKQNVQDVIFFLNFPILLVRIHSLDIQWQGFVFLCCFIKHVLAMMRLGEEISGLPQRGQATEL